MCDSKDFWSWLGCNAGQIQILIAIIALILAIIPIRFAFKQFKLSNAQRAFELKINLLRLITENIVEITKSYEKYHSLIAECESIDNILKSRNDPDAAIVSDNLATLKSQKDELFGQINSLSQLANSLSTINTNDFELFENKMNTSAKILVQAATTNVGSINIENSLKAVKKEKGIS
ncbi:hypothetical protein [Acinetobacter pittii]|uniref:hypothetical protein n=1 Tax=Acinetobacter pittii TaxID=48296 RepID=UPI00397B2C28